MIFLQTLVVFLLSTDGVDRNAFAPFDLRRINAEVVDAMRQAWKLAEYGKSSREAGVVVVLEQDGRYSAKVHFSPDSLLQVRMSVPPGTVALFHTHPNSVGYSPSPQDRKNADRLQIPSFTMTDRGLWAYNPTTGKTTEVLPMRSWLEHRNWGPQAHSATP